MLQNASIEPNKKVPFLNKYVIVWRSNTELIACPHRKIKIAVTLSPENPFFQTQVMRKKVASDFGPSELKALPRSYFKNVILILTEV